MKIERLIAEVKDNGESYLRILVWLEHCRLDMVHPVGAEIVWHLCWVVLLQEQWCSKEGLR